MANKTPQVEIIDYTNAKKPSFRSKLFSKKTNLAYIFAFAGIAGLAFWGSNLNAANNFKTESISKLNSTSTALTEAETNSVDQVAESNVIANLADTANLAVAPNTASLSVSMSVLQDSNIQSTGAVEKPKILEVASDDRKIKIYKTSAEENIQSIADKYGITAQTIKWVNNLKGDTVAADKEIRILPVDGIVYTIKDADKLEDIAKKYQADIERILSYNNLKTAEDIVSGQEIVIPGGILPEEDRPDYVAPVVSRVTTSLNSYSNSSVNYGNAVAVAGNYSLKAGNAYAPGNCTWYVYNMRPDIGSFWGNASSWAYSARAAGHLVDSNPTVGAIAQWNAYAGGSYGWGHVGYVEAVYGDGTILISEMNYNGALYRVTQRTIPASSVSNFIH
ncbi:MAG: LysM peptidoglycan-binding domain-containing protein [bacterium]|nr:LysM peptidoglycan-binding domain-containing protein [bacterium]